MFSQNLWYIKGYIFQMFDLNIVLIYLYLLL
jgi:hypothetical protein